MRLGTAAAALAAVALAAPAGAGAAAIEVTTTADELSHPVPGAGCSLREAVVAANTDTEHGGCTAGESVGTDAIELEPGETYPLTLIGPSEDGNLTGDLDLETADGVWIRKAAAGALPVIDANDLETTAPASHDRAIDLHGGGSFQLTGVRVIDGDAGLADGGGIRWAAPGGDGDLSVVGSELAGNFGGIGTAIKAETTGEHLIEDSVVRDGLGSTATVYSTGRLSVVRSTVSGNSGGGLDARNAGADALKLDSSAIVGNSIGADNSVGAVRVEGGAEVTNSTISGNLGGFVGGIEAHGDLRISFSTIADNHAPNAAGYSTGGIDLTQAGTVELDASIVAGNRLDGQPGNCNGHVDSVPRPSLEDGISCGVDTVGPAAGLTGDPLLAPLAANGGPTPTRGLYAGSPALDAVDGCAPVTVDQRGEPRPADGCDIGAFEGTVERPVTPPPPSGSTQPPVKKKSAKPKCKKKKRKGKAKGKRKKCVKRRAAAAKREVIGRSVRGRPIRATRIGDPDSDRVALVVGVIHGDERAGLGITRALRRMADAARAQVWVIDSLNPDGARARSRRNARGVDLNRNFPHRWRGGVPRSSGYYPGPRPASEPETRAAMRFAKRIQPDLSIWYHQPWGAVLACKGRPRVAARYATLVGMSTSCRGRGLPGTAISWERAVIPGAEAFVVELPARGITPRQARRHARAAALLAWES